MHRFRFSGEIVLPFATIGIAFAIYLVLMLANLLNMRSQLEPLADPAVLVARFETQTLESFSEHYSATREDLERLSDSLAPIAWFGQNMPGVPIAGPASRAVTELVARLAADLGVFESTIQAVISAGDLIAQRSGDDDRNAPLSRAELAREIQELKAFWSSILSQLREAENNHPGSWPLIPQFDRIASAENELAAVSGWGIRLLDSASGLLALADDVESVFLSMDSFEESVVASDELAASLMDLAVKTTARRLEFERTIDSAPDLIMGLPSVERMGELIRTVKVAEDAVTGASILAGILNDSMSDLGDEISGSLSPGGPIEQIAIRISERSDDIQIATDLLNDAYAKSDLLAAFLGASATERFVSVMDTVVGFASTLAAIAPVFPELVGTGENIEYLVLGQTTDELRANGGFVSSAWSMEFERGGIAQVEYKNVLKVDDMNNLENYPSPPTPLRVHMNAPVWLIRDATWSPHFPAAAETALDLYELGQKKRLSNVIGINTFAISRIVEALGGIDVRGERIVAQDITRVIETETDEFGTVFLKVIFDSIILELAKPRSRVDLARFALAILRSLEARELIMFSEDVRIATALRRADWDGSIAQTSGSRYLVTDSNVGWNKVDRNIRRTTSYEIEFQTDGSALVRLTASYENLSGEHPLFLGCDRQWHRLSNEYAALLNGCYWNYLRIYAPIDSRVARAEPMMLPPGSAYAEFGNGLPGEPTLSVTQTPFGRSVEGLIAVPAGEELDLIFEFIEPGIWSPDNNIHSYRLQLRSQPGVKSRMTSVEFELPDGYEIIDFRIDSASTTSGPSRVLFDLVEDTTISIQFALN